MTDTFSQALARGIMQRIDWRVEGEFPRDDKFMIVIAPHVRGAFEVLLGWCVKELHPIPPVRFLAKAEAYYSPAWPILKWLGGYPIDRKNTNWFYRLFRPREGYIANLIRLMKSENKRCLVILPEGTRKRVPWHRGFYEISLQAGTPIILVGFDYERRRVVIAKDPVYLTGQPADLAIIRQWYQNHVPGYLPLIQEDRFFTS